MSSGCKSAVGCVDARVPVRATYVNLYKWPESEAEFVRGLTEKGHAEHHAAAGGNTNNAHVIRRNSPPATRFGPSPAVVDSYSCRQIFLKSYTFTKKETVSEKTMRCFGKFGRERPAAAREATVANSPTAAVLLLSVARRIRMIRIGRRTRKRVRVRMRRRRIITRRRRRRRRRRP